jgi:uncharacterized protein YegL
MAKLPGGPLATRPLHFIWILDCSASMLEGGKIQSLNFAIRESIPAMQSEAAQNPHAQVVVRAITFADSVQWHIPTPVPVVDFQWSDVGASGLTPMGKALSMVADVLHMPPMEDRALAPVLVLISDGYPTDDFSAGLQKLMNEPWGRKAIRIAIAIGSDADIDVLQKFIGNVEIKPLQANNPESLVRYIRWASTTPVKASSMPASRAVTVQAGGQLGGAPVPVVQQAATSFTDVSW